MHDVEIPGAAMASLIKYSVPSEGILCFSLNTSQVLFLTASEIADFLIYHFITVMRIASLDIPTCIMGLCALSNALSSRFSHLCFFSHREQSLRVLGVSLLSRERNGTRPYNLK